MDSWVGFKVQGSGFRLQGLDGLGFRVPGLGFRRSLWHTAGKAHGFKSDLLPRRQRLKNKIQASTRQSSIGALIIGTGFWG